MAVDVILPVLGESVVEGTVLRWLVREGERVAKDQPLVSVSTDKVDAEIPSPAAGFVTGPLVPEGSVVPVKSLLCRVEESPVAPSTAGSPGTGGAAGGIPPARAAEAPAPPGAPVDAAAPPAPAPAPAVSPAHAIPPRGGRLGWDEEEEGFPGHMARGESPPLPAPPPVAPAATPYLPSGATGVRVTPVVSRMAAEHGLDLSRIPGTGIDGRVTKRDVERYLEGGGAAPSPAAAPPPAAPPSVAALPAAPLPDYLPPRVVLEEGDEEVPFTAVRRRIAAHMTASKRTSPHVHAVAEVDLSAVNRHRAAAKERGLDLTFLPYVLRAAVLAFRDFPRMNSLVDGGERLVVKRAVHLSVAVETDRGLLVPVVRNAREMDLAALAAAVDDLSRRARERRILPDEMAGGTFSVSNPGPKGNLFGMAILNQPQVGILRMGQVVRRPVVVTEPDGGEAIAVRPMMYLTLGYDHRVVDGVEGNGFLFRVREILEGGAFDA